MIETLGQKLYSSREVSVYLGVCPTTLGNYAKKAEIPRRFIHGVRYYTEEEIRTLLQIPGKNTRETSTPGNNL